MGPPAIHIFQALLLAALFFTAAFGETLLSGRVTDPQGQGKIAVGADVQSVFEKFMPL